MGKKKPLINDSRREDVIEIMAKQIKHEGGKKHDGWTPKQAAAELLDGRLERMSDAHNEFVELMENARINPQQAALAEKHCRRLSGMLGDFPGLSKDDARQVALKAFPDFWKKYGVK